MKKTNVLHFRIRNSGKGGATGAMIENWRHINKGEFSFDFICFEGWADYHDDLVSQGCKIHYVKPPQTNDKTEFIEDMGRIMEKGYDAVHIHTALWTGLEIEKIAMAKKIPRVIVHAHVEANHHHHQVLAALSPEERANYDRFKQAHERNKPIFISDWKKYATDLCACSIDAARFLYGDELTDSGIVSILKNAIDTEKFAYDEKMRNNMRKNLGLENNFVIGHVGRIHPHKNHRFILDAFKELVDRGAENVKLMLIGKGAYLDEIKGLVETMGLKNKVLFLGSRDDVGHLLQAMDVFILPSIAESLGIALVEAQAAGLRCFAADNITRESRMLAETKYLPLDKVLWANEIALVAKEGYIREDVSRQIKEAGYSIRDSVKILEKLYKGELQD